MNKSVNQSVKQSIMAKIRDAVLWPIPRNSYKTATEI